jgi:hypothetical protein
VLKLLALAAIVVAVALVLGVGGSDVRAGADAVRSSVTTILWGVDSNGDEQDGDPEERGSEP